MKVENKIHIYEIDGESTKVGGDNEFIIKSHWNNARLIDLEFDGKIITISKQELEKAITNASNHMTY